MENNDLVLSNESIENKVNNLSKISIKMANAIEKMNGAVTATNDVVSGLIPYIDDYISSSVQSSVQSIREEFDTKMVEMNLRQEKQIKQTVIDQNQLIEERKKKLKKAFESCVFRLLDGCSQESAKYILFHRKVRAYLNDWLRNRFSVSSRVGICNDDEKYEKAIQYLGKIKIISYEQYYQKWCRQLHRDYKHGFDKLKSGSRNEMIEAYEEYFGII